MAKITRLKPKWISSDGKEAGIILVADGNGGFTYSDKTLDSFALFEIDENGDIMPIA